jgi:hypothetical protein
VFCPAPTVTTSVGGVPGIIYRPPEWFAVGDRRLVGRRPLDVSRLAVPVTGDAADVLAAVGRAIVCHAPAPGDRVQLEHAIWRQAVERVPILTPALLNLFEERGFVMDLVRRSDCPPRLVRHVQDQLFDAVTGPVGQRSRGRLSLLAALARERRLPEHLCARLHGLLASGARAKSAHWRTAVLEARIVAGRSPGPLDAWLNLDADGLALGGASGIRWRAALARAPGAPGALHAHQLASGGGRDLVGTLLMTSSLWGSAALRQRARRLIDGSSPVSLVVAMGMYEAEHAADYVRTWRAVRRLWPAVALPLLRQWQAVLNLDVAPLLRATDLAPLLRAGDPELRLDALGVLARVEPNRPRPARGVRATG